MAPGRPDTPPAAGPQPVTETTLLWRDPLRARDLSLKMFLPAAATRPPVILFSAGLGATHGHYAYLARYWAERGYAVVIVLHPGSDADVFREPHTDPFWAVMRSALRRRNWVDRPLDLSFVIDGLAAVERINAAGKGTPSLPSFDIGRIGVAGHSYGAYTALASAGLRVSFPGSGVRSFLDPRVKAVIEMSFPGDMGGALGADAFGGIHLPCMHFSGTRDDTPMLGSWAADRRIPFDRIGAPDQYLVTIAGADHFALADNDVGLDGREVRRNPAVHRSACLVSGVFWEAFLRDDPAAREWLRRADISSLTRGLCTMETRNIPRK